MHHGYICTQEQQRLEQQIEQLEMQKAQTLNQVAKPKLPLQVFDVIGPPRISLL